MCGISGTVLNGDSSLHISELSRQFINSLHHRGPDGNGCWTDEQNILLCHNRLAIQDLSEAGKQPMVSRTQRYVITYNGEIYNFQELRSKLCSLGHGFRGGSDTEVLLAAFEEWGIVNSLNRFNGMFAFAVWDTVDRELTLARDRLGEKPLYYGWLTTGFIFSSELKPFKTIPSGLNFNESVIPDFLSLGYIPTPFTIYQNIFKLTPGTSISFNVQQLKKIPSNFTPESNSGELSPKPYWSVSSLFSNQQVLIFDHKQVVNQLEETLIRAVQRQLVADVPVGAFLSGGIDSSTVVALMQQVSSMPVKTFTIGFNVEQFNEAKFAKKIARHLGTEHTEVYLDQIECLSLIDRLPSIYDEPFADPSQLPTALVCEIARKHVTVCLSGDGGDELFAGYNRYISTASLLQKTAFLPPSIKKKLANILLFFNARTIDSYYDKFRKLFLGDHYKQASVGLKLHKVAKLLQIEDHAQLYKVMLTLNNFCEGNGIASKPIITKRIADYFATNREFVDLAMLTDQLNYLPDDNLTKVDRAAMSCALETRLPLLDKDVIELSWRIPWQIKLKNGKSKWPLRQILYKYVPQKLIDRPKIGFSVPISAWIRDELKDWSYELIQNLDCLPVVRKNYWQGLWEEHQSGAKDNGLAMWPALMLSLWLQAEH